MDRCRRISSCVANSTFHLTLLDTNASLCTFCAVADDKKLYEVKSAIVGYTTTALAVSLVNNFYGSGDPLSWTKLFATVLVPVLSWSWTFLLPKCVEWWKLLRDRRRKSLFVLLVASPLMVFACFVSNLWISRWTKAGAATLQIIIWLIALGVTWHY